MTRVFFVLLVVSVVSVGSVSRAGSDDVQDAIGACLRHASARYAVNPDVLTAIIEVESGWRPWAISYQDGARWHERYPATYDEAVVTVQDLWDRALRFGTGLGQISAVHLRELEVQDPTILLDPCMNVQWAGYVLGLKMRKFGNTWLAIERYNGINPAYPKKVQAILQKMGVWR